MTGRKLIDYSPEAMRQLEDLTSYYRQKQRPEAIRNLIRAMAQAESAIMEEPKRPRLFPASYRHLVKPGIAWIKSGSYWIAYRQTVPPGIAAVFWEGAAIDRRYLAMD